ncbi:MAG: 2-oxoglutarate dehydrogenase E1 component [Alphaproteobacteria bacterium]|jgi:2-oxoglutarate dehydrogenase E1 component|nr:2-oxoglutarate dehydrogenase E1 component [Alphaproteobacteria bacterium]
MATPQTKDARLNDVFEATSFLNGANANFIEQQLALYLNDPNSVDESWRTFFATVVDRTTEAAHGPSWARRDWPEPEDEVTRALTGTLPAAKVDAKAKAPSREATVHELQQKLTAIAPSLPSGDARRAVVDTVRAIQMIRAYRVRGHLEADLDPLKLTKPVPHPELHPESYGFGPGDLDRPIFIDGMLGLESATVRQMLDVLRKTYCGNIGIQFMHIANPEEKAWLQQRMEGADKEITFTPEGKKAILYKLIEGEGFERFCAVKFVGTKRFGLDGAESLIPALEQIIKVGGKLGAKDVSIGMPHRGRLNVLANVMAKPYRAIFHEFQGGSSSPDDVGGSGDVKYHLGVSSDREFDGNKVHLSLAANPSHLEAVNPVVLGKARAKQHQHKDKIERTSVIPILMHGDAAFAGQGIVAECFAMSGTRGYRTGGTIHVVVNNQIGFTTAPMHSRSSPYPSDVALMVQAPIFHVNGDNPEAVVYCARVATEFRQKFHKDVVIDMFCYRRFGHNETDEPMFTQPLMYKAVKAHKSTLALYEQRLLDEGTLTADELAEMKGAFEQRLATALEAASGFKANRADWLDGAWSGMGQAEGEERRGDTAEPLERLKFVGQALSRVPADFHLHKTIQRQLQQKAQMIETGEGIDWATAEALAFGTLLDEGFHVRLAGQDSVRGTFSQRHSAFVDQETEDRYFPLQNIREGQGEFEAVDSFLSEEAALGFEYGYTLAEPKALVLWEAQFGDFVNGAQVLIDQFITTGERKWLRMSGLVMLLPHGYEGQGPEHSSARLERFLQSCAEDNIQVGNISTPSNYFHALRRQIHRNFRKPLILMTPKSLLRHKRCVSKLSEMAEGTSFHRVLHDDAQTYPGSTVAIQPDDKIRRVVLCSGKVYYDLLEEREKRGTDDVYLMRVEQFYPFPARSLVNELGRFLKADVVWAQEEPKNMGAWTFMEPNIEWVLDRIGARTKRARYVGRHASASPAAGQMSRHQAELKALLDEALTV